MNIKAALQEIAECCSGHIITEQEDIQRLTQATEPMSQYPIALAYPSNTHQIQKIVSVANKYKISLWPCSRGLNWGYGTRSPIGENVVVVILEKLNKIIEVNKDLAFAVLEPGVSYEQLQNYLKENHIPLWCDPTGGPPQGSVIGNALDKGLGATPYGYHFENLCGLEVVLPNGELLHTGGGPSNFKAWHTYKWGTGPYLEGLFAQSNYGIVTKAGIWLMPEPESTAIVSLRLPNERSLYTAVNIIRDLALKNVLGKIRISSAYSLVTLLASYPDKMRNQELYLGPQNLKIMCKELNISPWTFGTFLYGGKDEVKLKLKIIKKAFSRIGKIQVFTDDFKKSIEKKFPYMDPSDELYAKARFFLATYDLIQGDAKGFNLRITYFKQDKIPPLYNANPAEDNCGIMWFAPVLPNKPQNLKELLALCRPHFKTYKFDFHAAVFLPNPRSLILLMCLLFRKDSSHDLSRVKELYAKLTRAVVKNGYQLYRSAPGLHKDLFQDSQDYLSFTSKIKGALDPNNIIAPGKYGIMS